MGYTVSDLLGVALGCLLFSLFAFAPGYTFASLTNAFDFRHRRLITRLTAAIPLSIALTPIVAYHLWRWSLLSVWIVFGLSGAVCLALLLRDARALKLNLSRPGRLVLAVVAAWLVIATLSLVDLQFGNRLYMPFSAHDLSTHTAFVAALARDGVPPHNPFFFAGQPAPLRYHYFFYIPCALVDLLGGSLVTARLSIIAGILWEGAGLMALIALYLRFFQQKGGEQIERRTLIAVSLLAVTGLDIVLMFFADLSGTYLVPVISWWTERIAVWDTTMLWAPHSVAGLVAGLAGFLLVWDAAWREQMRHWMLGVAAGALAFASAAGTSIYLSGTLAVACLLWLVIALAKRWWRQAAVLAAAGVLAVVLLAPYILQVTHGSGTTSTARPTAFPFAFSVRRFSLAEMLAGHVSPLRLQIFDAVFLPLNYFIEFGFFFVVGCLVARRIWRRGFSSRAELCAAALSTAALFLGTFLRSNVISYNDLGVVGPLIVEFFLLLWAADMWSEGILGWGKPAGEHAPRRAAPRLVALTLVLGAMSTCYDLCLQRAFPIFSDCCNVQRYDFLALDHQLGRRTFELRRAYEQINRTFPAKDVIQADPDLDFGSLPAEMYSDRQMVADVGDCGTSFGGSKQFCTEVILPQLKPLFADGDPVTMSKAEQVCREFSISALLFKDTDPVWKDKASWIWKSPALISSSFVRVIPCGKR